MTALHRKLLRDSWHLRGQLLAILLVVASGIAAVTGSRSIYESLSRTLADYYAAQRFADVFLHMKRAPENVAAAVAQLPGVVGLQTRIVFEATLDVPGLSEPATGRFLSVPSRQSPMLNDLYIREGRYLTPGARNEVMVGEAFALANGLHPGDSIAAVLNGRWTKLRIVATALSPEFIYTIRGTDIFPDNRRFGVFWMSREAMAAAFDMEGSFNDLVLKLAPGTQAREIIARLDRMFAPYGGLGAYDREDHISNRFISDEIKQNRVFGTVIPAIFLGVASFLLNIVLSRLIATQRDQIGVLKAFGYPHLSLSLHYLELAGAPVVAGSALGIGLGLWLAQVVSEVYQQLYRFPDLHFHADSGTIAQAMVISAALALVGALGAVQKVWNLAPAQAMRAEPPPMFRSYAFERTQLYRRLGSATRMVFRHLTRRPMRAIASSLGIALGISIIILGRYFVDAMDYLSNTQFRMVQREDVMLLTHQPLPARSRYELARLPGVMLSEPFRLVPVRLRNGQLEKRTALMGISSPDGLRQLLDERLDQVLLPSEGVVLTRKLGEVLGVRPGDTLVAEALEGNRNTHTIAVSGFVDELVGVSAYMHIGALNRFMSEGDVISGGLLRTNSDQAQRLYDWLRGLPAVASVVQRQAILEGFERTLKKNMGVFTSILLMFACVIAVAVVYSSAQIALSERGRELASLRVLGFTHQEITAMLLGEQAVVLLAAMPLGLAIGYFMAWLIASRYQWELFRIPLVITLDTYVFACSVTTLAAVASGLLVRRRLIGLDLVAVLKARE